MIRSSNLTLHTQRTYTRAINTLLYHSALAADISLCTLSAQPCMHPHITLSPLSVQLVATYITTYTCTCIAQSETIYTNDHLWLKSVASITTAAKQDPTTTKKTTVRTYSDTCMVHDKSITIPRIIG